MNTKTKDSVTKKPIKSRAKYNLGPNYTLEQKIVAAVWYHERIYTGISYRQLQQNFLARFKIQYPKNNALRRWECQLFRDGHLCRKQTSLSRLVHVPYVKESLILYPDLSQAARADLLGMPANTLAIILKEDIKKEDFVVKGNQNKNTVAADTFQPNKMDHSVNKNNDVDINKSNENEVFENIEIKTECIDITYDLK